MRGIKCFPYFLIVNLKFNVIDHLATQVMQDSLVKIGGNSVNYYILKKITKSKGYKSHLLISYCAIQLQNNYLHFPLAVGKINNCI